MTISNLIYLHMYVCMCFVCMYLCMWKNKKEARKNNLEMKFWKMWFQVWVGRVLGCRAFSSWWWWYESLWVIDMTGMFLTAVKCSSHSDFFLFPFFYSYLYFHIHLAVIYPVKLSFIFSLKFSRKGRKEKHIFRFLNI